MGFGKQQIQRVEGEWVAVVGSWQRYVPPTAGVPFSLITSWSHSWFGKKHTYVRVIYIPDVREF
jgi:hypothetical protein